MTHGSETVKFNVVSVVAGEYRCICLLFVYSGELAQLFQPLTRTHASCHNTETSGTPELPTSFVVFL